MASFLEFNEDNFPKMLKVLQHELPRSAMLYNVLTLKLSLLRTDGIKIRLFGYEETADSIWQIKDRKSIFLMALIRVQGLPQNLIVLFGPSNPSEKMLKALEQIIDWSQMNQFEGIENPIAEFLAKASKTYGKVKLHDPIELYFMEKAKALSSRKTAGKTEGIVKCLQVSDAIKINNHWPAACPGSLEMIAASIKAIGSGGVYIKKEAGGNEASVGTNSELVSWAVALPFGSIHALHTVEKFQKRGFAGLTMQEISKLVAEAGRIPVVQIFKNNDSSKSVNQKVGFLYSHDINLIHYYPC